MTTVNSISGGRTSAYMAIHYPANVNIFACVCIDYPKASPKDQAVMKYCLDKLNGNFIASAEDEKTLKCLMQLEQTIGKEIVWVRGKSFDEVINKAGRLPTWNRRFCTSEMKVIPIFEHVYFRYGVVHENIGFRYDEMWRAFELGPSGKARRKTQAIMKEYPVQTKMYGQRKRIIEKNIHWADKAYPMLDDSIERQHIMAFWKAKPEFDFPNDSNCAGCHHKSAFQIKQNSITTPEILEWFSLQEKKKKYNTWHDDMVPYEKKINANFTELLDFMPSGSCDTGSCTD